MLCCKVLEVDFHQTVASKNKLVLALADLGPSPTIKIGLAKASAQ